MRSLYAYVRLWLVVVLVLGLDQATKLWILHNIEPYSYHPPAMTVIDGFLYIVHIYNEGAAWGMFSGYGAWLAGLGFVALGCLFFFRETFGLRQKSMQIIFGMLIGGILGNLIDRILYSHVIDFIDVHLPGYRWPAFNIADSAISIGVCLYVFFSFKHEKAKARVQNS